MVKFIGPFRIARWKHVFGKGGGVAITWNGRRLLLSFEFHYERRNGENGTV